MPAGHNVLYNMIQSMQFLYGFSRQQIMQQKCHVMFELQSLSKSTPATTQAIFQRQVTVTLFGIGQMGAQLRFGGVFSFRKGQSSFL